MWDILFCSLLFGRSSIWLYFLNIVCIYFKMIGILGFVEVGIGGIKFKR